MKAKCLPISSCKRSLTLARMNFQKGSCKLCPLYPWVLKKKAYHILSNHEPMHFFFPAGTIKKLISFHCFWLRRNGYHGQGFSIKSQVLINVLTVGWITFPEWCRISGPSQTQKAHPEMAHTDVNRRTRSLSIYWNPPPTQQCLGGSWELKETHPFSAGPCNKYRLHTMALCR